MDRVEIAVSGRVQGVAYRWSAQEKARRLGLTGTVRNRPDGSVYLVAEGERGRLEILAAWAARGSERARVDHCEITWHAATRAYADFRITG